MNSNTKNILWGVGISLLVLVGLAYFTTRTSGAPKNAGAKTALAASETKYDFGTLSMAKGKVSHEFKVKNTNSAPVTIARVYTSCMCTQANLTVGGKTVGPFGMMGMGYVPTISETLQPGEEGTLEAIFDPAAHGPAGVGPIDRVITVETKDGADPLVIEFRAVVAP